MQDANVGHAAVSRVSGLKDMYTIYGIGYLKVFSEAAPCASPPVTVLGRLMQRTLQPARLSAKRHRYHEWGKMAGLRRTCLHDCSQR